MYKINEEKMFYDMADNMAIVINFITGMYYGTNTLGSAVLDRLQAGASQQAVLAALRALPGCPSDMDAQLEAFISRLLALEILVPGAAAPERAVTFDAAAAGEGFSLAVDEFAEAQDLLLADPVHDVDMEMGWPVLRDQ